MNLEKLHSKELHKKAIEYEEGKEIEKAIECYEIWLKRELKTPSDDSLTILGKGMIIDSDLRRDYSWLLEQNGLFEELISLYERMVKKVPYHWSELIATAENIKDKDNAIAFTKKIMAICEKNSEQYKKLEEILDNYENPKSREKKFIDTIDRHKNFEFIQFKAGESYAFSDFALKYREDALPSEKAKIPLGHSRYGGDWVDLPKDTAYPKDMEFVAQLDMAVFSQYDPYGWLPKTGQLYFFWNRQYDGEIDGYQNEVFYTDVKNEDLVRIKKDNDPDLVVLIENISKNSETLADRYTILEEEELEDYDEDETEWVYKGKAWNDVEAENTSKVFGIYTHCQWDPNDIAEFSYDEENVLLLQIGTGAVYDQNDELINGGFNDEGTLLVTIKKSDLVKLDFSKCQFEWAQT